MQMSPYGWKSRAEEGILDRDGMENREWNKYRDIHSTGLHAQLQISTRLLSASISEMKDVTFIFLDLHFLVLISRTFLVSAFVSSLSLCHRVMLQS